MGFGALGAAGAAFAQRGEEGTPAVAPGSPIAQLKSRRSEATPIGADERKARIEKAQRLMREQKLDAMCLAG